ncbi:MAG: alpha-ketoglutarate-dependent dioxygenase AlkB family protein [Flavobacteriaceae bacterium]
MNLFAAYNGKSQNLLPMDGEVYYYGYVLAIQQADYFFNRLRNTIAWRNDEAIVFGKRVVTRRKVAWYADAPFEYTYSNITKKALPWTAELEELKALVEKTTAQKFNSCLLNLYHNETEGMAWHSDAEKKLQQNGAIASLSFGAERVFAFKHKATKAKVSLVLNHGSLLVMQGTTQTHWSHRLPPTKFKKAARINLTFRTIVS